MKKKFAILEGDNINLSFQQLVAKSKICGFEPTILENIYNKSGEEIFKVFNENDEFLFQSTFVYADSIAIMAKLLTKIPSKNFYIDGHLESIERGLNDVLIYDNLLCTKLDHHKFFHVSSKYNKKENKESLADFYDFVEEITLIKDLAIDMREKIAKENARISEMNLAAKMNPTGRKIKIGKIQAFGEQWSTLKEGDVVDELDPLILEDTSKRGVWVWGKDEPVKLLNEGRYEEFSFATGMTSSLVLEEVLKWSLQVKRDEDYVRDEVNFQLELDQLIKNIDDKKEDSWRLATDLLDLFGIERRCYRPKLDKMIHLARYSSWKPKVLHKLNRKSVSLGV